MTETTLERPTRAINPEKAHAVLTALSEHPTGLTVDQFVSDRGWYVNSWAPTFTQLRQAGLIARTGIKVPTSHGATAFVVSITDAGRAELAATTTP